MRLIDADRLRETLSCFKDETHGTNHFLNGIKTGLSQIEWQPTVVSQEDIEVLKIIKEHFQVCFDDDSDNGLDTLVFNGFDLDKLWEDGYDEEFEKVKNWLWKG